MSVASRSARRNVHIYDTNNPTTVLGGLILTNGVTNANFYSMVEIICIFDANFFLRDDSGLVIQRDEQPLQPGNYYIITSCRFLHDYIVTPVLSPNRFHHCQ